MTAPDSSAVERVPWFASLLALLCGVLALAAGVLRQGEVGSVWGGQGPLVAALVVALAAFIGGRLRSGRTGPLFLAAALAAVGIVLSGLPDLPHWASIEDFGRSRHFLFVLLALLGGGILLAPARGRSAADAALVLLVLFSAFGGAAFARRLDDFYPLLILLAAVASLGAASAEARSWRQAPFLLAFLVFLASLLPATLVAADLDRHLAALARAAAAGAPLIVLGLGARDLERARVLVRAFAAAVFAGALCAAIALCEAGTHFAFLQALRTRLHLFGIHPNFAAPYFTVAPPLLLALLLASRRWSGRALYAGCLAAALGALWLTRSRAALAAAAAGLLVFAGVLALVWLYRRRPRRSTAVLLGAAVLLLLGGGFVLGRDKAAAALADSSMEFRVYIWSTALDAIAERPLLGHGLLNGEPLAAQAQPSDLDGRTKNVHPHNIVLALALGAGLGAAVTFLWLLALLAARLLCAAARLEEGRDRALAAGVLASAASLLVANLLDQGLAQGTPLPLHLGLLLGLGALLWRAAAPRPEAPARASQKAVLSALTLVAVLLAFWSLAADRLSARAFLRLQQGDLVPADRLSAAALRLNPFSLELGRRRAQVLQVMGRQASALELCEELAARHPFSPVPWEMISSLELDRGRLPRALQAARKARSLDPTGPLAAEWSLREGTIHLEQGEREAAQKALAEAFRYDHFAPDRLEWRRDTEGEWAVSSRDGAVSVRLLEVIAANTNLLGTLCASDPVKARRVASAAARIYLRFGDLDRAQAVIDEHRALSGTRWLPLDVMEIEILEKLQAQGQGSGASDALTAPLQAEEDSAFRASGQAGRLLAEGRRLRAAGRSAEALAAFRAGVEAINDMVAEQEFLGMLVDESFDLLLQRGEVDEAAAFLPKLLYCHGSAGERLDWMEKLMRSRPASALQELERAAAPLRLLDPGERERITRWARLAAPLLSPAAPAAERSRAERVLEEVSGSGAGLFLAWRALEEAGRPAEAKEALARLRASFPRFLER